MPVTTSLRALALAIVIAAAAAADSARAPAVTELAGTWAGTLSHDGETQAVALGLEPDSTGAVTIRLSMPVVHLDAAVLGRARARIEGDSVHLGPFHFRWDRAVGVLRGTMPAELVPVYALPLELQRVERFVMPARAPLTAPVARPLWTFDAGAALWAGPVFADGVVYVGSHGGRLVAIDARTGTARWSFDAGGPIRTRPLIEGRALYVQADDGHLYKVATVDGALVWKVRIVETPIVRLPFDDPKSRYDRFGSDVTTANGRLYVGTHDGKVLALDPADGRTIWEFTAGDAVLSAPAVRDGRVVFGSYDRFVYALDAATGALLWKHDTKGAVVSTPALIDGTAIVGNRAYDLLALDVTSGAVAWKRYVWMSWVESSAAIRDRVAYVGSSDAAAVFAVDTRTGKPLWTTDVFGWSWGQPAVGSKRVYAGTSSQVGYLAQHAGGVMALDRATGAIAWRFAAPAPDSGAFGFPGSPALGDRKVFAGGLDGRVYAFAE